MKNKPFAVLVVVVGLLTVSGPMFAHHSNAVFDSNRVITVTGTVTKFQFINPHIQIHFEVKDDQGNTEQWISISGTPNNRRRRGWNRNTIKPGDQITISGNPYKDGRPLMSTGKIILNGEELP